MGSSCNPRGGRTLARVAALVLLACCLARAEGSAIPMWEFLTRDEKMSHLYRIFSQEVSQYCVDSPMPDCNKNLLVTGLKNLANIEEDKLDEMDPYQRGAKDIIWRAMVGNNRQSGSRLGQQVFQAGDADPLAVGDNELPQESSASHDYIRPSDHSGPYLVGPMVIRVYPDGRPVPSDAERPLPQDEDIEDIRYNARLPALGDFDASASAPVGSSAAVPVANALAAGGGDDDSSSTATKTSGGARKSSGGGSGVIGEPSIELAREMLPPPRRDAAQLYQQQQHRQRSALQSYAPQPASPPMMYQRYALVQPRYYAHYLQRPSPSGNMLFRDMFY